MKTKGITTTNGITSTKGIKEILIETHNWGSTVAFWQDLGYQLEFETDHHSGRLRHPSGGPSIFVAERPHDFDRLTDLVEPDTNRIARLGILGVDINTANVHLTGGLRIPSGVIVVGHPREDPDDLDTGLTTGDTIHSINGTSVASIADVRTIVASLKPRSAVVLQVERNGQLIFLSFEMD